MLLALPARATYISERHKSCYFGVRNRMEQTPFYGTESAKTMLGVYC